MNSGIIFVQVLVLCKVPGLISTSSQTLRLHLIKVPQATHQTKSSITVPGRLTSKDLTIINLGGEVKSLKGIGILQRCSTTTSILYLN